MGHAHVHTPHELTEPREAQEESAPPPRSERRLELASVYTDALYTEGTEAKSNDDRYILATVFFAAVLFFAGISLRLDWRPLKIAVLGMALTLLLGGAAFVFTLPLA